MRLDGWLLGALIGQAVMLASPPKALAQDKAAKAAEVRAAPAAEAKEKAAKPAGEAKAAPGDAAARPNPAASYGIAGIRAYLYYHGPGTIGTKDITDSQVALWNTIIGEGDAEHPSNGTMIYVDLVGPSFASTSGSLEVVVKEGKKTLTKQKLDVGLFFSDGQKLSLPVLVIGTGCDEVSVTATYTTAEKKKVKRTATIAFACGE
jgi:hypothetical protein